MRKENDDDLRERFPDPETDERLKVPSPGELPPVPEVTFTRPNSRPGATGENSAKTGGGTGASFRQEETPRDFRNMGAASTIGFSLVGSIVGGTLLGWLADHYVLHSGATPWGLIIGFFAGVFSGFMNLIRSANRLNR